MRKYSIKEIKNILKNTSAMSFECPNCTKNGLPKETTYNARSGHLWDVRTKTNLFFIKCLICGFTTPAFPTLKEAYDYWEECWVTAETEITDKMFK